MLVKRINRFWIGSLLILLLVGCTPVAEPAVSPQAASTDQSVAGETNSTIGLAGNALAEAGPEATHSPRPTETTTPTATQTQAPPATPTGLPTQTPSPTEPFSATPTETATFTPSLTPSATVPTITVTRAVGVPVQPLATAAGCRDRMPPEDDLLVIVTKRFGISGGYIPPGLVSLNDYFDHSITRGYPTLVREVIVPPLVEMVTAMEAAGLEPFIISGYRDFYTQSVAYEKWSRAYPDRADLLSARPGHSEHQLGTTVDFGSYNLAQFLEEDEKDLEFHTYFYKTAEGEWLKENAHHFGFSLSYPREAQGVTGFYYEPWHYRYIGKEMATQLWESGLSLTEHQIATQGDPC